MNPDPWIEARKRHHLSHAHVQMARELGMNPRKLGKIDNHKQQQWKAPLPQCIEHLYEKRFGRTRVAEAAAAAPPEWLGRVSVPLRVALSSPTEAEWPL